MLNVSKNWRSQYVKKATSNIFSGHLIWQPDIFTIQRCDYRQGKLISTSQTQNNKYGPLILGGSGRVGRMLAALWPRDLAPALWQRRAKADPIFADDLIWDILDTPAPDLPRPVCAVIVLAGVTNGSVQDLLQNTALAEEGCALGTLLGVRTFLASSQAVYGRKTGVLAETCAPTPATLYGQAKWDMEQAVGEFNAVTCLRIGNVAGCDGLFKAMARGPTRLDQFCDGAGPRRMMIGPHDLAHVLAALSGSHIALPKVLNVARPGLVALQSLADAAGVVWNWQPAPDTALPVLAMDVSALGAYLAQPSATAADLVAQARAGGWAPAL